MSFRHLFFVTLFFVLLVSHPRVFQPTNAQVTSTQAGTPPPTPAANETAADSDDETRSQSQYDTYRLYEDRFIYGGYRKQVRPVNDYDTGLDVSIRFNLLSLIDVNSQSQTLEAVAELQFSWVDSLLVWNPDDYGGIDTLVVQQQEIWLPDVIVENSVVDRIQFGYKQMPARVDHNGQIAWSPVVIMKTDCDISVTYYPFDTQSCTIDLVTEVSYSYEIRLYIDSTSAIMTNNYNEDGTWELMETRGENIGEDQWEDKKSKITYSILLKRRNTFYIVSIILPVLFLTMTSSLVFALPADSGEKMSTGLTVLLAYAVYLTIISDYLPDTSVETSYLALTLTILLGYTALSVIVTAFTLRIHHKPTDKEPVGPKVKAVTHFLQRLMCKSYGRKRRDAYLENRRKVDEDYDVYRNGVDQMYVGRRGGNQPQPYLPVGGQSALPSRRPNPVNHVNPAYEFDNQSDNHYKQSARESPRDRDRDIQTDDDDREAHDMDWPEVAKTIDWLFFVMSCFFTIGTVGGCIVLLVIGAENNKPSLGGA